VHIHHCNVLTGECGCRRDSHIKMAVKEVGCGWINLACDRVQWAGGGEAVVNIVLNV
jgi:hypothetical protein